jgi:hypothetical protein
MSLRTTISPAMSRHANGPATATHRTTPMRSLCLVLAVDQAAVLPSQRRPSSQPKPIRTDGDRLTLAAKRPNRRSIRSTKRSASGRAVARDVIPDFVDVGLRQRRDDHLGPAPARWRRSRPRRLVSSASNGRPAPRSSCSIPGIEQRQQRFAIRKVLLQRVRDHFGFESVASGRHLLPGEGFELGPDRDRAARLLSRLRR